MYVFVSRKRGRFSAKVSTGAILQGVVPCNSEHTATKAGCEVCRQR